MSEKALLIPEMCPNSIHISALRVLIGLIIKVMIHFGYSNNIFICIRNACANLGAFINSVPRIYKKKLSHYIVRTILYTKKNMRITETTPLMDLEIGQSVKLVMIGLLLFLM